MKIAAGALYFSIIIALVIAMICSSLIVVSFYFKLYYLQSQRQQRLTNNIDAGLLISLKQASVTDSLQSIDLYGDQKDSITILNQQWGIFKLVSIQGHIQNDTLQQSFLLANKPADQAMAIYLSDEDRPLSVSQDTRITGTAILPKSGIKQSYVEGKPYTGKHLVDGQLKESKRTLIPLSENWMVTLSERLSSVIQPANSQFSKNVNQSFQSKTLLLTSNMPLLLSNIELRGNIVILSDTIVSISANAVLDNIQLYAKEIRVESGFKGNAQLFASDSIVVEKNVTFDYPSCLGVLRDPKNTSTFQPKIFIGENVNFNGSLFTYEAKRSELQTLIYIRSKATVKGEIYSTGIVRFDEQANIIGSVSCNRFLMKAKTTTYENFLINVKINAVERSKYYLSSPIFSTTASAQNVLKWLN